MKVEGRIGSKKMLINYLKKSHSLFTELQNVAENNALKEKFGDSISNIEESIKIIDKKLSRNEIKLLVRQIRQNIQDNEY